MRKFLAMIVKDIRIQFKNPFLFLFFLGLPIVYLLLFRFMIFNSSNDLEFYVDRNLSYEFNSTDTLVVNYLEAPIKLSINYMRKDSLLAEFNKGKLPVIYYKENNEKIMHLNLNKEKATIIYNILEEKFYPVKFKKFTLKKTFSMNYMLLSMVFNFLLIFSSLSYGSTYLGSEISKQNILLLLKSGISKSEIILGKIVGIFLIQILAFTVFYVFATSSGMLAHTPKLFFYLPFIIIPVALVGIFISSITPNENIQRMLPMLLWFPSMIYPTIKSNLSDISRFLINLDPLVVVSELVEQIIRNDISIYTIAILSTSALLFYFLSIFFLKRTIIKSM